MTLAEIKQAVDNGHKVFWKNTLYKVHKDSRNQYLITHKSSNSSVGLTYRDGINLVQNETEFYIC